MLETVAAYIERYQLLPTRGKIIVAVSGGADSLCLLHLLHQLCGPAKRYPELHLHVAHLNHKLRGEASAHDAAAVARIAAAWGLPATIGELDVPSLAHQEHRSLEDAARTARYRFLREIAQGQPIAVAHHADDQVETILLHYLRGGGLASVIGMQPRQQDIIRPLLEITHAQTLAYCQQHHIIPLEDTSNADPRFLRNRIRHQLLPLLESMNPGIRTTLLRNAEVMCVDLAWIEAQLDACWPIVVISEQEHSISLKLQAFLALSQSLQRHLLRRVTAKLCAGQSPLELRHYLLIEQLLHLQNTSEERMLDLPHHLHLTCHANEVILSTWYPQGVPPHYGNIVETLPGGGGAQRRVGPRRAGSTPAMMSSNVTRCIVGLPLAGAIPADTIPASIKLSIPGRMNVPGTLWMATAEIVPTELLEKVQQGLSHEDWPQVWQLLPSTPHTVYLDADAVGSHVYIRTRQPGDRIRPLGMAKEKKVQDILVNKHIPRSDRSLIPLFFSDSHCIWLAGICLDDRVRLTNKTQRILRLSITNE